MYKELIQSLKELSFVKVAELKDELTIGQDVIIYDYFYLVLFVVKLNK